MEQYETTKRLVEIELIDSKIALLEAERKKIKFELQTLNDLGNLPQGDVQIEAGDGGKLVDPIDRPKRGQHADLIRRRLVELYFDQLWKTTPSFIEINAGDFLGKLSSVERRKFQRMYANVVSAMKGTKLVNLVETKTRIIIRERKIAEGGPASGIGGRLTVIYYLEFSD